MKSQILWSNSLAFFACIILGYFLFQETPLLGLLDILGFLLWIAADRLDRGWMYTAAFVINIFLITIGTIFDIPHFWIIVSFGLFFTAYDFKSWWSRIAKIESDEHLAIISQKHFLRFGLTLGAGLILSVLSIQTVIKASFGQIFFLGLLLIISLNLSIGSIQKLSKPPRKRTT